MSLQRSHTVVVSHENAVIEAGLRHILSNLPGLDIEPLVYPNRTSASAARDVDLMVLDQESGMRSALAQSGEPGSNTKVMVVAMAGQEIHARAAIEAGVRGYVLIDCAPEEIANAALAVVAGRRHLCSAATMRMADSLAQPALTQREQEVIAMVFRGANNKAVARSLNISVGTVKSHMRGVMTKLGARCRTEASWIASQRGLIGLADETIPMRAGAAASLAGATKDAKGPSTGYAMRNAGGLQLVDHVAA